MDHPDCKDRKGSNSFHSLLLDNLFLNNTFWTYIPSFVKPLNRPFPKLKKTNWNPCLQCRFYNHWAPDNAAWNECRINEWRLPRLLYKEALEPTNLSTKKGINNERGKGRSFQYRQREAAFCSFSSFFASLILAFDDGEIPSKIKGHKNALFFG